MSKISLYISYVFFFLILPFSCEKQNKHGIERIFDNMTRVKSPEETAKVKSYTVDSLNFIQLDSLGLTKDYINVWIKLYLDEDSTDDLVRDSKRLIDRLGKQSPKDIELFIKSIANNDVLTGYPTVAASIVAYAYGIDIPANEYSEIATRLFTLTRLPGSRAPLIDGLNPQQGISSTLVLFYDGSCGICQHILEELADNYETLTVKGVRIVTISADTSKDIFEQYIAKYPWTDKLCDYQSFNSTNFKRFGVAATPMMFVIDKNGIVIDQFQNLEETGLINTL